MKWAQLKYPLLAGLGASVVVDYTYRFYSNPPPSH